MLIAGRFTEKKGIPYAMRALGEVSRAGISLKVTVIGNAEGAEGEIEKQRILAAVREAGLSDHVAFLGSRTYEEFLEEGYRHHIFISPSVTAADGDTEGGAPVSILEMAAAGLPVLSTRHCDIPDVLGASNRALLSPERDSEALAEACLALLAMRDWSQIAAENRALVERDFDCRHQGERLAQIYFPGELRH